MFSSRFRTNIRRQFIEASLKAQAAIDALWGYDVFIAHRHVDAAAYAKALYSAVRAQRISGFLDVTIYGPGDSLVLATKRHVTKSTIFILLGSPELLVRREPIDWIEAELTAYLNSHSQNPIVIVIAFGPAVTAAFDERASAAASQPTFVAGLKSFLRVTQSLAAIDQQPSDQVLDAINQQLKGRRRDQSRLNFFRAAASVLGLLLIAAVVLAAEAYLQRNLAQSNEHRALHSLGLSTTRLAASEFARGKIANGVATLNSLLPSRMAFTRDNARNFYWYYLWHKYHHETATLFQGDSPVVALQFAPDGSQFASSHANGAIILWSLRNERPDGEFKGIEGYADELAFSPDGNLLATTSTDNTTRLWDTHTKQQIARLDIGQNAITTQVAFSPDGRHLAGFGNGNVIVLNLMTLTVDKVIPVTANDRIALTYSSSGALIAGSANSDDFRVQDLTSNRVLLRLMLDHQYPYSIAVSPDGESILLGPIGDRIKIYSLSDAQEIASITLGSFNLRSLTMTDNTAFAAGLSYNGEIQLWDVRMQQSAALLTGHEDYVNDVAFSPDLTLMISASEDGTIKLWHIADLRDKEVTSRGGGGYYCVGLLSGRAVRGDRRGRDRCNRAPIGEHRGS